METTFKEEHYPNGVLMYKHQFLNGKKHGEQLKYYKNGEFSGQLWYKRYYINGKEVSEKEWLDYQPKHKSKSLTDMYV